MEIYLNGGKGIENPIDFLGNPIKEGDILTFDSVGTEWEKEYTRIYPFYMVFKKTTDSKTFFFGLGLKKADKWFQGRFYCHDFCFKETIKLGNITYMPNILEKIDKEERDYYRFKDNNIIPDLDYINQLCECSIFP